MATIKGVGVNFGVDSTTIGSVKGLFQDRKLDKRASNATAQDGDGDTVTKVYYDYQDGATFTYVPTGSKATNVSITDPDLPTVGGFVTVTDASNTFISGSNWLIDDVSVNSTNTSITTVSLTLTKYPNILP